MSSSSGKYKPATLEHPAQNVPLPKYPEAAKKDDRKGREAAAKFFFQAADYAKETGSDDALRAVAYEKCSGCYSFFNKAEKWYEAGRWIVGGKTANLQLTEEGEIDEYGRYKINFILDEADAYAVRKAGQTPEPEIQVGNTSKRTLWVQYSPEHGRVMAVQLHAYEKKPRK